MPTSRYFSSILMFGSLSFCYNISHNDDSICKITLPIFTICEISLMSPVKIQYVVIIN